MVLAFLFCFVLFFELIGWVFIRQMGVCSRSDCQGQGSTTTKPRTRIQLILPPRLLPPPPHPALQADLEPRYQQTQLEETIRIERD